MRNAFILPVLVIPFILNGCDAVDMAPAKSWLDSAAFEKYYSEEIIPFDFRGIYGTWQLYGISGGFSGMGYEINFDYLVLKPIGIYGLVRNDSLFEYGSIQIIPPLDNSTGMLAIKFLPDYYSDLNPYYDPNGKYVTLKGRDSLNLISPCCDNYNWHFIRK